MDKVKAARIAKKYDVYQSAVEGVVDLRLFTEDNVEAFIRHGVETGNIKSNLDYEFESLVRNQRSQ